MTRRLVALPLAATMSLAALLSWPASYAQADNGVSVAPFYQNATIGQDQSDSEVAISLTNNSTITQSFKLSTVNFGSLNNTGGVAFLGSSPSQFAQNHGLTSWMSLNESSVTLYPGSNSQMIVTIHNSSSLSVGGHYGAVLATEQSAPTGQGAKPQVGVLQVLSSLILLVKAGGPPPDLVLVSQKTPGTGAFALPSAATDSFEDQGDTHVVPRGLTVMQDPTGNVVMKGGLNIESGIILPGMYRSFTTPMIKLASAWLPGNYTLTTTYHYDGASATKVFRTSFWYWGPFYVWLIIAIVLLGAAIAIWWWRLRPKA